jgi:hypothetical protein
MSVSIYPGTIAFTLTPNLPVSFASARVNPSTPALLAAYATAPAPPCKPSRLATLIITGECIFSALWSWSLVVFLLLGWRNLLRKRCRVPSIVAVRFVARMDWRSGG